MNEMKELQFTLSLDEANLMLKGLGKLPFEEVYALINKLQAQASQQLNANGEAGQDLTMKTLESNGVTA